ncbi:MAG: Smr/MutS family protein [Bacteroidetes bacterium]|nr:Smr/MutS family protein [Bacteroidota bacterium]
MKKEGFREGDFVSFLNEKQEGIVKEILDGGNLIVDIEDGFPIEVTAGEIVLVKRKTEAKGEQKNKETEKNLSESPELKFASFPELLPIKNELYLLIVPTENQVSSGPVRFYLINATEHDFVFTLHSRTHNKSSGFNYGTIPSGQCNYLSEIKRDQLFEKGEFVFDALIFQSHPHNSTSRIHKTIEITLPDISQTFPKLPAPLCFAKTVHLFSSLEQDPLNDDDIFEKLKSEYAQPVKQKTSVSNEKQKNRNQDFTAQFGLTPSKFEVDLHIEELTDQVEKLNNSTMLEIQLGHFRKELDLAMLRHAKSIVFIHGIGNGKLKAEIRRELTSSGIRFADGAYNRYGAGATEVFL